MSGKYSRASDDPYSEGVVEVQFDDSVRPGAALVTDGVSTELRVLKSKADVLEKVNTLLRQHGLLKASATFQTPPDEADRLYEEARSRGYDLPHHHCMVTLHFPGGQDTAAIARELAELPGVVRAVPVPSCLPPQGPPSDPLLGASDQLQTEVGSGLEMQWYIFRCKADKAWAKSAGKGVVVANIDWGFDLNHVDLKANLDKSKCFNAVDGTSNVSQGAAVEHGTATMSLIGAVANNVGLVGFAPEATLWAIQGNVSGNAAGGRAEDASRWGAAIEWVRKADSGGRRVVINLEAQTGTLGNYEMVPSFRLAIQYAMAWGIVVCLAAGNGNRDAGRDDQTPPQQIPDTGSIVVGATRFDAVDNIRWSLSNWGARVTVYAPGDPSHDVTANDTGGWDNQFGGTSGATPKVAGTVALMLAVNPALTCADIRKILIETGTPLMVAPGEPPGVFLDSMAAVCNALELVAPSPPSHLSAAT